MSTESPHIGYPSRMYSYRNRRYAPCYSKSEPQELEGDGLVCRSARCRNLQRNDTGGVIDELGVAQHSVSRISVHDEDPSPPLISDTSIIGRLLLKY